MMEQLESDCLETRQEEQSTAVPQKPRSAYHAFVFEQTGRDFREVSQQQKGKLISRWWKMSESQKAERENEAELQLMKYRWELSDWRSKHMKKICKERWSRPRNEKPIDLEDGGERGKQFERSELIQTAENIKGEDGESFMDSTLKSNRCARVKLEEDWQRTKKASRSGRQEMKGKQSGRRSSSKGEKATPTDMSFVRNLMSLCFGSAKGSKLPVLEFTFTGKLSFSEQA